MNDQCSATRKVNRKLYRATCSCYAGGRFLFKGWTKEEALTANGKEWIK